MVRPAAALVLACILAAPGPALASQRAPAREAAPAAATAATAADQPASNQAARETRSELERLLDQYPPSLARVLRLDPTLLQNPDYVRPYPALASFLAQHPEVAHNPSYFLARYDQGYQAQPQDRAYAMWDKTIEGFMIVLVFSALFSGVVWLIKTAVDHRRWAKLTKIQTDVHTKLLDRFTSNEDLLAYIQSPAGRKFLESTPIAIDSPRALSAPLGRILWSAQVSAVLVVVGIGIEVVAARAIEEVSHPLSAIGVIVIALGIGFGLSAALAYFMSRRLGLLGPESATMEPRG